MPPRTKQNSHGLGKSIINRKAKDARVDRKTLRYTEEAENLRSVTHEKDLDEFLNSAALADADFTADRAMANVKVITTTSIATSRQQNPFLLSSQEQEDVSKRQNRNKDALRVPRRPLWTAETTRDELEKNERENYLHWRRGLAELAEGEKLLLTPYERNIQVWRQLWRVIERSHLIVQIVDARNPLTFRCKDLEDYVSEVGVGPSAVIDEETGEMIPKQEKKGIRRSLLLINKAAWADYFDSQGVKYAFFSAADATAAQEQAEKQRRRELGLDDDDMPIQDAPIAHEDGEDDSEDDEGSETEQVEEDVKGLSPEDMLEDGPTGESAEDMGLEHELAAKATITDDDSEADDKEWQEDEEAQEAIAKDIASHWIVEPVHEEPEDPRTRVLTVLELEELFESAAPPLSAFASAFNPEPTKLMVGLVGYPNVGKSSTINALLGSKKVSVSSTPGKTKHFQTLPFSDKVTLCDCPGLVFPQFVNTEAELVCDGVLPIDQMREVSGPIDLICRRVPREILEGTYGIRIDVREVEDGGTGKVGWEDLLSAYAIARGLTRASFGMPDTSRAARYVLKDYVNAKLVFCHPPPGIDEDDFMEESRALKIAQQEADELAGKKKAPVTRVSKFADTFVPAAPTIPLGDSDVPAPGTRQATSKSINSKAASAPNRPASHKSRTLENQFFTDSGPFPKPVAKGAPGIGHEGGYSRTTMYPHTQAMGPDGLPVHDSSVVTMARLEAIKGNGKKHFKIKDGKKRSGRGYD
ncbi:hypothetical protein QFC24_002071 [Naganishia onofrii]|uniref:Uncharacterized protein n=1 Tax=Naganishia onofrii TaxID=1851511 RepID=A0ACC2XQQ2_9TREE|nr:hypothetical protein QFC24_002071 [Naganishia onofrii]